MKSPRSIPVGSDERRNIAYMRMALALSERGLGRVAPNPAVGCVLVKDGVVIGRGWTQPGGRPHAETEALRRAGEHARGSAAYVTLEPCSHHGQTPPCADALIEAGVTRVFAAMPDPDDRVAGRGLDRLRSSGIEVSVGLLEREAQRINRGFVLNRTDGRPLVTLKLATTLDGAIATSSGDSKWITGPNARAEAHRLRATHDAILVGIGTALADDPALTCRLPGLSNNSPIRVVLDRRGRLPDNAKLRDGEAPLLVLSGDDCEPRRALSLLAEKGVTRLLVEGGASVAASFLGSGFVDRLAWFHAGAVIGGDGLSGIGELGLASVSEMPRFKRVGQRIFSNGDGLSLFEGVSE